MAEHSFTTRQSIPGDELAARLELRPETAAVAALHRLVLRLSAKIAAQGGQLYLVGGAVRDELFGLTATDLDCEVFGIDSPKLSRLIHEACPIDRTHPDIISIDSVGRSFGIVKIHTTHGDLDIGLPRRDSKHGTGHRDFDIQTNPKLPLRDAARRRDFTINALMKEPQSGRIIDPVGGLADLDRRCLRLVDPATFSDDPLRVLRAFQLIGRFRLSLDASTASHLREMLPTLRHLPAARLRDEWTKLLLKSDQPSLGLLAAKDVGYFAAFIPALDRLSGAPSHGHDDAWQHALDTVDRAQRLCLINRLDDRHRLIVLLTALIHETGQDAALVLTACGYYRAIIDRVSALVRHHEEPWAIARADRQGRDIRGPLRRLANAVHPANLLLLAIFLVADRRMEDTKNIGQWFGTVARQHRLDQKPEPILWGRDLVQRGWVPGPPFGRLLDLAERLAETGVQRDELLACLDEAHDLAGATAAFSDLLPATAEPTLPPTSGAIPADATGDSTAEYSKTTVRTT